MTPLPTHPLKKKRICEFMKTGIWWGGAIYDKLRLHRLFVMGSEKSSDTTWFENTRLLVPPINRIIKTKCERWRFLVILIKSFIGDFVSGLILWVASIEMWRQTNKVHIANILAKSWILQWNFFDGWKLSLSIILRIFLIFGDYPRWFL